jgi:hypothetical protein
MIEIKIEARDRIIWRFGNQLATLGDGMARTVMMRALNHESDKGRTQVKRALVRQTGIKYSQINKAVETIRATPASLEYVLKATGDETNLNLFNARQGKRGVSAAPWGKRQVFKHSFTVPAYGNRVYVRTSDERGPLKPLYGPNFARELVKDETAATFRKGTAGIADRVAHEIARVLI